MAGTVTFGPAAERMIMIRTAAAMAAAANHPVRRVAGVEVAGPGEEDLGAKNPGDEDPGAEDPGDEGDPGRASTPASSSSLTESPACSRPVIVYLGVTRGAQVHTIMKEGRHWSSWIRD
jgi:hypothetical protein